MFANFLSTPPSSQKTIQRLKLIEDLLLPKKRTKQTRKTSSNMCCVPLTINQSIDQTTCWSFLVSFQPGNFYCWMRWGKMHILPGSGPTTLNPHNDTIRAHHFGCTAPRIPEVTTQFFVIQSEVGSGWYMYENNFKYIYAFRPVCKNVCVQKKLRSTYWIYK